MNKYLKIYLGIMAVSLFIIFLNDDWDVIGLGDNEAEQPPVVAQAPTPSGSAMAQPTDPMGMALNAIEQERAEFCVQGQFKSALLDAVSEDKSGATGLQSSTVLQYQQGVKDQRGNSTYKREISRGEAVSDRASIIESVECDPDLYSASITPMEVCNGPLTDYFFKKAEKEIGPGPFFTSTKISKSAYESALAAQSSTGGYQSALAGFNEGDQVRVEAECGSDLKLIRSYAEAQCSKVMPQTDLITYAKADHRSSEVKARAAFLNLDTRQYRKPTEICDNLSSPQSGGYSFVSDLNELFTLQQASPWRRVVGKNGPQTGGWADQVVTYEANARFGNFIFEASIEPWPVSLNAIDASTANAIRAFNAARGIYLEKDGVILIPSIHIKANTTDQIWKGRSTMIAVAHPAKQPYTLQQHNSGLGKGEEVSYTVPAPDDNTWAFLRKDHSLMIIIPPSQNLPPMSFAFSRDGLAPAIDGFMAYMAGDAKKLLETGHFTRLTQ